MMPHQLHTPCVPEKADPPFSFAHPILGIGSCFVTAIGDRLRRDQFRITVNPFGIVYNPISMAMQLDLLMAPDLTALPPLHFDGELYHSLLHHGSFSHPDRATALAGITTHWQRGRRALQTAKVLILTWGHTDVYIETSGNTPVANCHKRPGTDFELRTATLAELIPIWEDCLTRVQAFNPELRILLTVSPVRYLRRGAIANIRSKATLHLLADHLCNRGVHYFPAYEIIQDELRDYRFYEEDLIHPSSLAVDLVYQRFLESWHDPAERPALERIRKLWSLLHHRSLHPGTASDLKLAQRRLAEKESFRKTYPQWNWMFEEA